MSVVHLSYVVCDRCTTPASQPQDDAKEARALVPPTWDRRFIGDSGRREDICPACKRLGAVRVSGEERR